MMVESVEATRFTQLEDWLKNKLRINGNLIPLAGDASFRNYYRLHTNNNSYVVMNAPPDKESCQSFIKIANELKKAGIEVPEILAQDLENGFLLLTDFGDQLLIHQLNPNTVSNFYFSAFNILLNIQKNIKPNSNCQTPSYTSAEYQRELDLFQIWYIETLQQKTLTDNDKIVYQNLCELLIAEGLQQPQVFVHRDFHSRNLMLLQDHHLGVLDFQDGLWGPISYDLVSLVKDCYIQWPNQQVHQWILQYQQLALTAGIIAEDNSAKFIRWCDWIGLQRHLKCVGIFARLQLRDNKPAYLQYIPRIMHYIDDVVSKYPEFKEFKKLMGKLI